MNLSGSLKIFPAFLFSFILVSGIALATNCQTEGNYKVCFYEKYNGISHYAWNISIEDLSGPPPSSVNISTLIDSTNFPASKVSNAKLYTRENVTHTVPDYGLENVTTSYNSTNTTCSALGCYDLNSTHCLCEEEVKIGNREEWEWRWQRAKEQYFKRNAKRFTQGMGTFKVPQNPKWFRYEFDTPVQPWSKGRFALNVNDVQFDPWWNSTFSYRYPISNIQNGTVTEPIAVNDTAGIQGDVIWAYINNQSYVYSTESGPAGDIAVANDTTEKYWENESSRSGNQPTLVWNQVGRVGSLAHGERVGDGLRLQPERERRDDEQLSSFA